jgi:hypothetical protein
MIYVYSSSEYVSAAWLTRRRDMQEGIRSFLGRRTPDFKATLEEDGPPNYPWWTEIDTGRRLRKLKL